MLIALLSALAVVVFRPLINWWVIPLVDGLVLAGAGSVMVIAGPSSTEIVATAVVVGGALALASGITGAFSRS
jgi:hypothetical protein